MRAARAQMALAGLAVIGSLAGCAGGAPAAGGEGAPGAVAAAASGGAVESPPRTPADDEKAIAAVLDDWHDAAGKADEARYFGHLADDSVFLGTDITERWDKKAFQAYAHPHFAKGKAWKFRAVRRAITLSPGNDTAWFDEDLETEKLGPGRGTGALVRTSSGWKITLYNLSIPIPNERFDDVKKVIAGEPCPPASGGW